MNYSVALETDVSDLVNITPFFKTVSVSIFLCASQCDARERENGIFRFDNDG